MIGLYSTVLLGIGVIILSVITAGLLSISVIILSIVAARLLSTATSTSAGILLRVAVIVLSIASARLLSTVLGLLSFLGGIIGGAVGIIYGTDIGKLYTILTGRNTFNSGTSVFIESAFFFLPVGERQLVLFIDNRVSLRIFQFYFDIPRGGYE